MAFLGPALLAWLALFTDDDEERRAAVAEGEALLAAGSVSHNYFFFYRAAIETALASEDWARPSATPRRLRTTPAPNRWRGPTSSPRAAGRSPPGAGASAMLRRLNGCAACAPTPSVPVCAMLLPQSRRRSGRKAARP